MNSAAFYLATMVALSVAICGPSNALAGACVQTWDAKFGFPGANSPVYALLVGEVDGLPALFAGGRFTAIAGLPAAKVARWNGVQWLPLGTGISGVGAAVHVLANFDEGGRDSLFVGGEFTSAGGQPATRLARWNGSAWSGVNGGLNGSVFSLAVFDDGNTESLFVGGAFSEAGTVPAEHVARWDGSAWSAVGPGLNGNVLALTVFDDGLGPALYAGGEFSASEKTQMHHIARWDGVAWSALDDGLNGPVYALAVFDAGDGPQLYAGGSFTNAAGAAASSIVSWNGESFASVGGGTDAAVRTLAVFDDGSGTALYAGGTFQFAGGVPASRVARWDGSNWSALAQGANNAVFALASAAEPSAIGPGLFLGGSFGMTGTNPSIYIGRWVDCGDPPGDVNGDGAIDLADFAMFPNCLRSPDRAVQLPCRKVDMDFDTDVDLRDIQSFENLFTGSD